MMGFGIRTPEDIAPVRDIIDGVVVGSHLIRFLEQKGYDAGALKEFCSSFKKNLQ